MLTRKPNLKVTRSVCVQAPKARVSDCDNDNSEEGGVSTDEDMSIDISNMGNLGIKPSNLWFAKSNQSEWLISHMQELHQG